MAEIDPKVTILSEIKKGHRAIKEVVRLYKLLDNLDDVLLHNKKELGDRYSLLKDITKQKDGGEIFQINGKFYWKNPTKL